MMVTIPILGSRREDTRTFITQHSWNPNLAQTPREDPAPGY